MHPQDDVPLLAGVTELVGGPIVEASVQCVQVDLEDEDVVEQVDERIEFREPPQKKVSSWSRSAIRALTWSTRHRWCSCLTPSVGSPVSGSPW